MGYINVVKPTGTGYTKLNKSTVSSVVAARGQYYGFGALTYSGNEVMNPSDNYTDISKPTGTGYTKVAKPT